METVGPLVESFKRELRAERLDRKTIHAYALGVLMFVEYMGHEMRTAPLDILTRENLRNWIIDTEPKWKPNTIRTHFSGVRRFANWLVVEEIIESDPTERVVLPVEKEQSPEILSDAELQAILKSLSGKDFESRKDTALVRLLLDTGMRAFELLSMTVSGTDLDNEMTVVTGKRGKVRRVYFSSRTVSAIDRYLRVRSSHKHAQLDALFLTQRGPMSQRSLNDRIAAIGREVGIEHLHPHRFRHTWAHDHLLNGTSTVDLKRLAGWSSDAMLSRYGASGADVRAEQTARRQARGDRV